MCVPTPNSLYEHHDTGAYFTFQLPDVAAVWTSDVEATLAQLNIRNSNVLIDFYKLRRLQILIHTYIHTYVHTLRHCVQTHPASNPMGNGGSFSGGKAVGTWSWPFTSIQCLSEKFMKLYLHSSHTLQGLVLN